MGVAPELDAPLAGSVERWAWDYVLSTSLAHKLAPPPTPALWEEAPPARRLRGPGRPSELRVVRKAPKTRGLTTTAGRARAIHTFLHHELQAAELMAWAILAFPEAPRAFRTGLLGIAQDEVRHMGMYREHLGRLGYTVGAFAVRDWFWERVPSTQDAAGFVATMGLGFEGANLEHARAFAARFRTAGDEDGATLQEAIAHEELAHVRFGARWFTAFKGELTFDIWQGALPAPLSPMLMRGRPLDRSARTSAGFPGDFLDRLEAWQPDAPGS